MRLLILILVEFDRFDVDEFNKKNSCLKEVEKRV